MHPEPSLRRVQVRTADPEVGHQVLRENYLDFDVRLCGDRQRFCFTYDAVVGSGFSLARMRHSTAVDVALDATGDLVVVDTLRAGRWQMQVGREQDRATPGTSLLAGQRGELHTSWEDVALDVVALDGRLLNEVAAQITDDESAPVHFLAMTAVSASAACYWRALVRHLEHDVLARDELIAHPLVRHAVVHQAITLEADDDAMDDPHRHIFRMLLAPSWAHGVGPAVDITLLGRFYERYADHAVTVARRVVYVVTGRMPRPLTV
jgi:hypothetical protein